MPDPFAQFVPGPTTLLVVTPLAMVVGLAAAAFVGWLRVRRGVRVPYTRKTFHFIIMTVAVLVQLYWGASGVVLYGTVIALIVLAAVWRGSGLPFYEAIARPTDAPYEWLFVIVPLTTTALGGVLANVFFPAWAAVGYTAVAWGDAVGEPAGTMWGKRRYRVPSLAGVPAERSIEGSMAVLVASSVACAIVLRLSGVTPIQAIGAGIIIGAVTTVVEAVSHHGLDNLTIQVAAAGTAALLLG